jgi:hypothetical protein
MKIKNRDWLNENETRNYPIKEGLSRASSSGYILPNNFIADLVLAGTETYEEIAPSVLVNIDYFIYQLEVSPSAETILRIRECLSGLYDPGDSATYRDVGAFHLANGQPEDSAFYFTPNIGIKITGKVTVRKPFDGILALGTIETFTPDETALEARALIPLPGTPKVDSLQKEGDAFQASGDVVLGEETGIDVIPIATANGFRLEFTALKECATNAEDGGCLDDGESGCPQPAVMTLNNTPSDDNFNFKITGANGINVSALPTLIPGGNPFDPSDYVVNSVVVTYHGPITSQFLGGDPLDPNNYVYGLNCGHLPAAQSLPNALTQSNALLSTLDSRKSFLSLL